MRSGMLAAAAGAALVALPAAAQAPPPLALTAADVHQAGARIVARLTFGAPVPGSADPDRGRRICVSFPRARLCLHGDRATLARPEHQAWVIAGHAAAHRRGNTLTLAAAAADLCVALGHTVRWTAASEWNAPEQAIAGSLSTRRTTPFAPKRRLKLLATGDSMIQVVDSYLKSELPGHRVVGEAHVSTGISKPGTFGIDWVRHAAAQARDVHPDATVVYMGPNEGFPIAGVRCCGRAWIRRYARRATSMMRSYMRGGRALVYWLTLPPPRNARFAPVFRAVNHAIRRAGRRFAAGVHVVSTRAAPGGRQPDGVHLNIAGSRWVAQLVIRRLRADRAIR